MAFSCHFEVAGQNGVLMKMLIFSIKGSGFKNRPKIDQKSKLGLANRFEIPKIRFRRQKNVQDRDLERQEGDFGGQKGA